MCCAVLFCAEWREHQHPPLLVWPGPAKIFAWLPLLGLANALGTCSLHSLQTTQHFSHSLQPRIKGGIRVRGCLGRTSTAILPSWAVDDSLQTHKHKSILFPGRTPCDEEETDSGMTKTHTHTHTSAEYRSWISCDRVPSTEESLAQATTTTSTQRIFSHTFRVPGSAEKGGGAHPVSPV